VSNDSEVNYPANAWFINSKSTLKLYIPSVSVSTMADAYGEYWNVASDKDNTYPRFDTFGFNDEVI
jgi:hypothetical protein